MSFSSTIEKTFKTLLPAPFTIAVVLTILTMVLAFTFTSSDATGLNRVTEVLGFWEKGLWNAPLLVFAMQMMLMLVSVKWFTRSGLIGKVVLRLTLQLLVLKLMTI